MTERKTISDAERIVIEKESRDLDSMRHHAELVRDSNYSETYKQASGEILKEEVDRLEKEKPDPYED